MVKIRSLGFNEYKQVTSLIERFSDAELHNMALERLRTLALPLSFISHCLPLGAKFLPEIYVAVDGHHVLGMIWLARDGHRTDRLKIEEMIIDPEIGSSLDVGKQLVYYVINRFGAMGVETFLAYVDNRYDEGLALLKECGFRHCSRQHLFEMTTMPEGEAEKMSGIREAVRSDARKLQELHSETLVPEVRVSLRKSPNDLYPSFWEKNARRLKGELLKSWVVTSSSRDYLRGFVSFSTWDYKHFDVTLLVTPAWEEGYESLMHFVLQEIRKASSKPIIRVEAYEFQKSKTAMLEKLNFQRVWTSEILVKDYWIPMKDRAKLKSPVILFAERGWTSPA